MVPLYLFGTSSFWKKGDYFLCCQLKVSLFFPFLPIDSHKVDMTHIHPLESNEKKTIKIFKFGLLFMSTALTAFSPSKKTVFILFYLISQKIQPMKRETKRVSEGMSWCALLLFSEGLAIGKFITSVRLPLTLSDVCLAPTHCPPLER